MTSVSNFFRRDFLKLLITGFAPFSVFNKLSARDQLGTVDTYTPKTLPTEEMRPRQIIEAIKKGPYAFVPVSPAIEWHSFHLPMGTDSLISEAVCRELSDRLGGLWFRPLSLGLDAWRDKEQKKEWGFKTDEEVFGMNFPDLPLKSEY